MSLPKVKPVNYAAMLLTIDALSTRLAKAASLEFREFQKHLSASRYLKNQKVLRDHYSRYAHATALFHIEHVRFAIAQDAEVAASMAAARTVSHPHSAGFTQELMVKYIDYINTVTAALKELDDLVSTEKVSELVTNDEDPHAYLEIIDDIIESIRPAEITGVEESIFSRHYLHARLVRLVESSISPVPPLHSFAPAVITLSHAQTESLVASLSNNICGAKGWLNNQFGKNDLNFGELDANRSPSNRRMGVMVQPVEVYAKGHGYVAVVNGVERTLTKKEAMDMIVLVGSEWQGPSKGY